MSVMIPIPEYLKDTSLTRVVNVSPLAADCGEGCWIISRDCHQSCTSQSCEQSCSQGCSQGCSQSCSQSCSETCSESCGQTPAPSSYVEVSATTESSITAHIEGLDTSWDGGNRACHWYASVGGYSTSSSDYFGSSIITGSPAYGGSKKITGLSDNTKYYITCIIKNSSDSVLATKTATAYTDAITVVRPSNWYWNNVAAGVAFSITATEWNNFTDRINKFRVYKGKNVYNFSTAMKGKPFTAVICNEAISAIGGISTTLPTVSSGGLVMASTLIKMANTLNSVT